MTIFSRIINGEIPCYKIAEDDRFFAFLDINPVNWGHTLVVPKHEEDYIFDLDDDELAAMTLFAKRVAKAIKEAIPCKSGRDRARSRSAARTYPPRTAQVRGRHGFPQKNI